MEVASTVVMKDVQLTGAVDQRSIRISVTIEIGPDKLLNAGHARKGMNRGKGAVAVIAQDGWRTGLSAQDNVQIAVGFDIRGPRTGIAGVQKRSR